MSMSVIVITGSSGLIGSEAVRHFARLGHKVIGIDNDMRKVFFGDEASTYWNRLELEKEFGTNYQHVAADIRDFAAVEHIFREYASDIKLVVHTAAQPSHDWAASDPITDFSVNANGTLNLLELTRKHCPDAVFIFTSTNKVYGDTPNRLPLNELETRFEISPDHTYWNGIREDMSVDNTLHSLFGVSKLAADALVQEYGRYFGMKTGVFRGGCLTGPNHSGTQLHGFLAYLVKCVVTGDSYKVFGYEGKQVRDNIHSTDLINAFDQFFRNPRVGEVYNIGGGRFSNCSMKEAIAITENIANKKLNWTYSEQNRIGDHIWYISDNGKFKNHYPDWQQKYSIQGLIGEIYQANLARWSPKTKGNVAVYGAVFSEVIDFSPHHA
jgi:CDP-paratose 2-epimerase